MGSRLKANMRRDVGDILSKVRRRYIKVESSDPDQFMFLAEVYDMVLGLEKRAQVLDSIASNIEDALA